jgi:tripartite-type tricarboxylate transporter receptor subunit TctC
MRWLTAALLALQLLAVGAAHAQAYPNKVVKLMVGFPAGQGTDTLARILAERLSASLKQQVIVENRPGQGGSIALAALAKSPADGYTIMLSSNGALVVNPHLFSNLAYNALRDVKPVGLVAELPMVVVAGKAAAFADLKSMMAHAKANPGKLNFASTGTFAQLWAVLLEQTGGVQFHHVPYPGSSQAAIDLMAGRVDFSIDTIAGVRGQVNAGELKLLATGPEKRLRGFPNVPTIEESGLPGIHAKAWLGVVAPAGTPDEIVQKLNAEINAALDGSVVDRFEAVGATPRGGSVAEFGNLLRAEHGRWGDVVRSAGIKAQ